MRSSFRSSRMNAARLRLRNRLRNSVVRTEGRGIGSGAEDRRGKPAPQSRGSPERSSDLPPMIGRGSAAIFSGRFAKLMEGVSSEELS